MDAAARPKLICVTPIRNEAWILERFCQCASTWADHIIIGDQCSDDASREIAQRFPKVTLVDNKAQGYDEGERQRVVFEAARRIPGKRVLLAIDADEAVTANWSESVEWDRLRAAAPGTVIRFQWLNLLPGCEECWAPPHEIPMGFVDDEVSGHSAGRFHVPRLPIPPGAPALSMSEVKVLHYQYTDWDRMKSKQRGYQCYERIDNPRKRAITLFRQFHKMDAIPSDQRHPVKPEWLSDYERQGIEMRAIQKEPFYRWDAEILEMFNKYGRERFRKLNIWDVDWNARARAAGITPPPGGFSDPRNGFEKRVHAWLLATQPRAADPKVRMVQRALRLFGW